MKPFKRIAGIAMSLAMTVALVLPMGVRAEDTVGEAAAAKEKVPNIEISIGEGQPTPEFKAGETDRLLEIKLRNRSQTAEAKNIIITPVIDDANTWPFSVDNINNEVRVGDLAIEGNENNEAIAQWSNLVVRSDIESKYYKLPFKITYDDSEGNVYQLDKYVHVKANAADKPEEEKEQEEENTEPPMEAGGFSNGEVSMSGGGGGSTEKSNVPRVIVTGFNTDPGAVNAGSDFKLIIHLKNTSARTAVSNMLFDLQAPSSGTEAASEAPAFLPSSGSSTIYLDSIPAGGTQDISIALNARADLVQKPYSISMSMKYEDSDATQYESSSSLAIPVKQAARFEFSDLEIAPEAVAVGEEANITCSLYNTGRIKLYNVKAKFQGDGIEGKDVFVGNVDSGATGSIDGIVTATKEMTADQKCKMVVSYEDESGKASTVEKEFSLQITPEQAPMDMSQMAEAPMDKGLPIVPIVIAVAVVAAVVIIIIVLKMRKKKMKSVEEEDLLDEVDRFTEDE